MLFKTVFSAFLFSSASLVYAKTWDVIVSGGLGDEVFGYHPNHLEDVEVGDKVDFYFHAGKVSVTQSQFTKPCQPLKGGFDVGV